ncbi:MAG: leucine-rich repeat domain-containing protein [Bacilli bacterium]|nr:leucine-rich repeat domain-containing protein [Bacilli bacterium]
MKKLGLLVMPLLAISFLVGCNHKSTYHFKFIGDHCTLNGKTTYEENIGVDKTEIKYTITPDEGYQLDYLDDSIPRSVTLEDNVLTIAKMDQDYIVNVNAIDNDIATIMLVSFEPETSIANQYDVVFRCGENDSIKEVDWGDGIKDTLQMHNYASAGEYLITIRGELTSFRLALPTKLNKCFNAVKIYSKITSLFNSAFCDCHNLISLHFPKCVNSIGNGAFQNCSSLTYIDMPYHLDSFGEHNSGEMMFCGCSKLQSIIIPGDATTIGSKCFWGCASLTSISIPNSVTSICDGAFVDCFSLTSISIPNGVTSIGVCAFEGCFSLPSIIIPDSVTSISSDTFRNCASLTSINIPTNPSLISIPDDFCNGCISLPSIAITNNIKRIGPTAFKDCFNLSVVDLSIVDHLIELDGDSVFAGHADVFQIRVRESLKSEYMTASNWSKYADYIVGV